MSFKMTTATIIPLRATGGRMCTARLSHGVHANAVTTPSSATVAPSPFVDCEQAYAASTFPIPPEKLIQRTKELLAAGVGPNMADDLASDYQFIGPVVGPLSRDEFLAAMKNIDFKGGLPDLVENYFGFHVDPIETNRVWYMARGRGTHTGTFLGIPATGKKYEGSPEVASMMFNADGKVVKLTVGVCADRTQGNTGGLGAAFGILYAIGKPLPFPEAQPWKKSWQYSLFSLLGSLTRR